MLDKATVLTTLFPRVDDAMKGSTVIQDILKRPGPAPSLSENEVVTTALYQELLDSFFHHIKRLIGDRAYNDAALQEFL